MAKILIIDDDVSIANLISDVLQDEGFETHIETEAAFAYDYIDRNEESISLITLDIMMPDISGLELCRFIRSKVRCPIIFISAKGRTVDAVEGFEAGADDYISKPFVVEELVARIKAHLRRENRKEEESQPGSIKTVSYTHLTLPTMAVV